MIESALSSPPFNLSFSDLPHYIQNDDIKLFKLHGSVNWAREIDNKIGDIDNLNARAAAHKLINMAPDLKISDRFRIVPSYPIGEFGGPYYPAIALPVEMKSDFECPSEHRDRLFDHLGKVTKILTIGWAAQEQNFLKELKDRLTREISIYVVAAGKDDAEAVLLRIRATGIRLRNGVAAADGFTKCTVRREFEKFFKEP